MSILWLDRCEIVTDPSDDITPRWWMWLPPICLWRVLQFPYCVYYYTGPDKAYPFTKVVGVATTLRGARRRARSFLAKTRAPKLAYTPTPVWKNAASFAELAEAIGIETRDILAAWDSGEAVNVLHTNEYADEDSLTMTALTVEAPTDAQLDYIRDLCHRAEQPLHCEGGA